MEKNGGSPQGDRTLTTRQGHPVGNNQSQRTVGSRGPATLENYHFLEKISHFDRERIPERVVHARGFVAYGEFEATGRIGEDPASRYTRAKLFQEPGKKTALAVRFSTVIGGRDSSEVARDPRGFAVKFYTEDGNWDLVGNNLPVFFIRDAIKFPDVIHALKPDPVTFRQEPNRIFDFMSQTPESMHMLTYLFGSRGIPASYRHMEGFGVNTYKMVNAEGATVLVKYHFHPRSGVASLTAVEAASRSYRAGQLGISPDALGKSFGAVLAERPGDARAFFERHFRPFQVEAGQTGRGFVTGYYEPTVAARREPSAEFSVPLYARPDDLVKVDEDNRPAHLDPAFAFARRTSAGLEEYFDRRAIERGALGGRGLEIAWLADKVDAFFIHVQGAARLRFPDGDEKRVTYAAKTGHPFTGPGGVLAELGEIAREAVTMQSIRAWFRANPHRIDEILHRNRSFIFFREAPVADETLGPVAAAKVPLTPARSLAVDRLLHTFGTPIHVSAESLSFGGTPFRRLMVAQDTGSAIVGPARGDIFVGSGDAAGVVSASDAGAG
jgi:membrane-bound lytic murein transglycosylase